jgi:glycosyltransferase involved in cell wall biosynthesis
MNVSVIIPAFNEAESLPELLAWIDSVCTDSNLSYEALVIDDGSKDDTQAVIKKIQAKTANVRYVRFQRNYGKSAALQTGFERAKGDVVITMDADLQDSPDEIPALYGMIINDKFDLVSGWKQKRYDPITKTIPTKLYN